MKQKVYIGIDGAINHPAIGLIVPDVPVQIRMTSVSPPVNIVIPQDANKIVMSFNAGAELKKRYPKDAGVFLRSHNAIEVAIDQLISALADFLLDYVFDWNDLDVRIAVEIPSRRWQGRRVVNLKAILKNALAVGFEVRAVMDRLFLYGVSDTDMIKNLKEVSAHSTHDVGLPTKERAIATLKYYHCYPQNKPLEEVTNDEFDALVLALAYWKGWI